jgi:hypothetical protein
MYYGRGVAADDDDGKIVTKKMIYFTRQATSSVNNTITWMINQKGFGSGRSLTEVTACRD